MKITKYPNRFVVSIPTDEMQVLRLMLDLALLTIKRNPDKRLVLRAKLSTSQKKAMSMWVGRNPLKTIDRDETDYRQDDRWKVAPSTRAQE